MYLLDTCVVAELMKPPARANAEVMSWLKKPVERAISVITIQEIRYRVSRLPEGKRKEHLTEAYELVLKLECIPFVKECADIAGTLQAKLEKSGIKIHAHDLQIAATAQFYQIPIATRNIKHFEAIGIALLNPWNYVSS